MVSIVRLAQPGTSGYQFTKTWQGLLVNLQPNLVAKAEFHLANATNLLEEIKKEHKISNKSLKLPSLAKETIYNEAQAIGYLTKAKDQKVNIKLQAKELCELLEE